MSMFSTQSARQLALNTMKSAFFGHTFWDHFYSIVPCGGPSMLLTLNVYGDCLLISKLHASGRGVRVGDVISYMHPMEPDANIVKRVVGMPGDFVLVDPLVDEGVRIGKMMMAQVPEGHCWVAGDNLPHSIDSRHHGPVPLGLIRGKAIARIPWKPMWLRNGLKHAEVEESEVGKL